MQCAGGRADAHGKGALSQGHQQSPRPFFVFNLSFSHTAFCLSSAQASSSQPRQAGKGKVGRVRCLGTFCGSPVPDWRALALRGTFGTVLMMCCARHGWSVHHGWPRRRRRRRSRAAGTCARSSSHRLASSRRPFPLQQPSNISNHVFWRPDEQEGRSFSTRYLVK